MTLKKLWSGLLMLVALGGIAAPAQAGIVPALIDSNIVHTTLDSADYYTIFLAAIIVFNIFFVILYKIFHRKYRLTKISPAMNIIGSTVAFLLVAAGSALVIIDGLVLITVSTDNTLFISAYYAMENVFSDVVFGIIITGSGGLLLFLVGLYILILLHGNPLIDPHGMPSASGAVSKAVEAEKELEPLNPTLTFRVIGRDDGKAGADVKVILRQRDGIKFHTKFTNFNGEVQFQNVEGYANDYYAYVDGDEKREIFRVILV